MHKRGVKVFIVLVTIDRLNPVYVLADEIVLQHQVHRHGCPTKAPSFTFFHRLFISLLHTILFLPPGHMIILLYRLISLLISHSVFGAKSTCLQSVCVPFISHYSIILYIILNNNDY